MKREAWMSKKISLWKKDRLTICEQLHNQYSLYLLLREHQGRDND